MVPPNSIADLSYNTLFCRVNRAFPFSTGPRYNAPALREQASETGGTREGSRSEVRGSRNFGSRLSRTFRASCVTVRRPGSARRDAAKRIDNPQFPVAFELTNADVMVQDSELRGILEVVAQLDRDGEAGPAELGDIEDRYAKNPTVARGWNLKIRLEKAH
jgi:hypothetical protein